MIEIRSAQPLAEDDKITPRVLEAFKSGVTRVVMDKSLLEISTKDGCCMRVEFMHISAPTEVGTELPYLRKGHS